PPADRGRLTRGPSHLRRRFLRLPEDLRPLRQLRRARQPQGRTEPAHAGALSPPGSERQRVSTGVLGAGAGSRMVVGAGGGAPGGGGGGGGGRAGGGGGGGGLAPAPAPAAAPCRRRRAACTMWTTW